MPSSTYIYLTYIDRLQNTTQRLQIIIYSIDIILYMLKRIIFGILIIILIAVGVAITLAVVLTRKNDATKNATTSAPTITILAVISTRTSNLPSVVTTRTTITTMTTTKSSFMNNTNPKWIQNGTTIAGGNGYGNRSNQLYHPRGIYVDVIHETIYIADTSNHRIVAWKYDALNGQVVVGEKGKGDRIDQLNEPIDVILDQQNDSLIICDQINRRVMRWFRRNGSNPQILIANISCSGLAMDNNGNLYVSDSRKHEVRQWNIRTHNGTIVAGGNEAGVGLNQLNSPTRIFIDQDQSVYVSDSKNHRVMKWLKDAREGIIVAGGQETGNISLTRISTPDGVIVDHLGNIYVADIGNNRVIRWSKGSHEGRIVVGGNGYGNQPNQFSGPRGLSLDQEGNLFVVDMYNSRIQKFTINN